MHIDFLIRVFEESREADAVVWRDRVYSYDWLLDRIVRWRSYLESEEITPGSVCMLEADFSPNAIALFLALIERRCITAPLTTTVEAKKKDFAEIAGAELIFRLDSEDNLELERTGRAAEHELYARLRDKDTPGLILFSSGSTGQAKAAIHDLSKLLRKFHTRRHNFRTLTFLLFDHIGGVDTLLYSLSNGSCIITTDDRSPHNICRIIDRFRVEVLPVTPTFLNLLLLSGAYKEYDMSSLKYITYGTEVMPESTLRHVVEAFPNVRVLQKYGTTEVGTLRSKSKDSASTWVKIGGEGYDIRIVDDMLQIKADSAMLGYLNAPSPFTDDGWFITGDQVQQQGEYIRFLGRKSEIINVGGEKVFPTEVENVIQEVDNVAEVTVYSEKNALVGNIVCARVSLAEAEDPKAVTARIKKHCRERMENYKVPVKIEISDASQHTERFKKIRSEEQRKHTP